MVRYRRQTHVTPKTYLTFLGSYKNVFGAKAEEIGALCSRMESGLAKLFEASETVNKLKSELADMERDLAEASATAEMVLVEVTNSAREAEIVKDRVLSAKNRAKHLVDVVALEKGFAEEKLAAAKPALEEAEAALNTIRPAHIATVRKLGRPPPLIMRIMDCVLILFQRKIQPVVYDVENRSYFPSWNDSLKMMAHANFLQQLQNFPKDTISEETVELLEPYFRTEDYNMEMAQRVCGDVAGLLSWTRAMAFFFSINKEVLPLKIDLAMQQMRLNTAMVELANAEMILAEKEAALSHVKRQYEMAMKEKKRLTEAASVCRRKMAVAAALISGLSGEKLRWTNQCLAFKEQVVRLVGDAILATAFLSYSGPFNQEFRSRLTDIWKKTLVAREIPFTQSLNVIQMLAETSQIAEWTLHGLPSDDHSIQNATIVLRSSYYPLLIDPQGQGNSWIKSKELKHELQITSLNHKYFRNHLEDSLSLGRPLLIEDVGEELDPALENLLNKNFIRTGTALKVMIGDKDCDVTAGFQLYVTTKLPNPAYSPEVSSNVAIVDFTVTQKGLEDQLLARVVSAERSELEAGRVKVFESVVENNQLIKQLEDNLLSRLTSTEGSLIDDEDLISVLHETKNTAQVVNHKLVVAAEMEQKINTAREEFRPVATRGSILYFLIVEMSHVNVMYQNSLKQFLKLFDSSINKASRFPDVSERVTAILSTLNHEIWQATLRGLYERHQFLFTLLMSIKIDLHDGKLTHNEFMKFVKGGASLDLNAGPPKPFKWILDVTWLNLVELSSLAQFSDLLHQVKDNEKEWHAWVEKDKPEQEEIPCGYSKLLDPFPKLLLIRSWCPDRMLHTAQTYVAHSLGQRFTDAPMLDLESMFDESEPRIPMICILTTCSDPSMKIETLAKQKEVFIHSLSMGQGQEVHALKLITQCMTRGYWLLLQNCHLNLNFCDEILDMLLETEVIHPTFRLWLTTEVHPQFPISLLQTAIKFTNEPPQGVRASLKRTFADMPQDLLEYSTAASWPVLLYTLSFMHTVLQERRKYGTLGWNVQYEFNQSDLAVCIQCVQNHLDDMDPKKGISWPTVCYMVGEAQYGGRVTDDFDKRLLCTFTQLWFSERLFQPGFEFYRDYGLPSPPNVRTIATYLDHVAQLPAQDSPEVLGLHANADVTYQINRYILSLEILKKIKNQNETGRKRSCTRS